MLNTALNPCSVMPCHALLFNDVKPPTMLAEPSETVKTIAIEKLKIGDYFRPINGKSVLVRGEYNRCSKRYESSYYDDVNKQRDFKKGTQVEYDFEF